MIRPYLAADYGFCRALWVRGYGKSRFARACGPHYDEVQTRIVRRLVAESSCLVACDEEDAAVLWGFVCWSGSCLHFVGVAREMRGSALSTALMAGLEFDRASHEGWRTLPFTPQEGWPPHAAAATRPEPHRDAGPQERQATKLGAYAEGRR